MTISIGDREIGLSNQPFIIAEMSGNHNQDIKRALAIVKAASESGASAIKLQTYTADTITLDSDNDEFVINDPSSLWKGQKLYDLYDSAHTPWDWHQQIFDYARELGLICFSSPFDESAVDFLEELDAPAYKIASFENNHLPLIAKVAKTGKPVIISTGMATLSELDEAVSTARDNGCEQLILLKCTSTYPASPENTNLRTIRHMRDLFNCEIGKSKNFNQELYKRFIKPFYLPILALTCCFLLTFSKEHHNYTLRIIKIFVYVFLILVISEIFMRYIQGSLIYLILFLGIPVLCFLLIYNFLLKKVNNA